MRNIMAWLIAPVGMAATMLLDDWISGPIDSSLRGAIALVVVTMIYAYPALLFGVPPFLWFRKAGIRSWAAYMLGGGLIGCGYGVLLAVLGALNPTLLGEANRLGFLFLCFLGGASSAAVFRAIVRLPDDNNSAKRNP